MLNRLNPVLRVISMMAFAFCFAFLAVIPHASAKEVGGLTDLQIIDKYDGGQNDRACYWDKTPGKCDPTDCNGFSIRACQILIAAGRNCRIVVDQGHAFILTDEGYLEPQLGGFLGFVPSANALTYDLNTYLATFPNAGACVMVLPPELLPPAPTATPTPEPTATPTPEPTRCGSGVCSEPHPICVVETYSDGSQKYMCAAAAAAAPTPTAAPTPPVVEPPAPTPPVVEPPAPTPPVVEPPAPTPCGGGFCSAPQSMCVIQKYPDGSSQYLCAAPGQNGCAAGYELRADGMCHIKG